MARMTSGPFGIGQSNQNLLQFCPSQESQSVPALIKIKVLFKLRALLLSRPSPPLPFASDEYLSVGNSIKRPPGPSLVFSLAGAADKMHLPAEQEEEMGEVQSPTESGTPETETSVPNVDYSGGGAPITIQPGQPDYAADPAVLHPSPMPSENTAQKEEESKATIFVMVAIAIMQTAAGGVVAYVVPNAQIDQTHTQIENDAGALMQVQAERGEQMLLDDLLMACCRRDERALLVECDDRRMIDRRSMDNRRTIEATARWGVDEDATRGNKGGTRAGRCQCRRWTLLGGQGGQTRASEANG
ncbi:hypothetical protein ACLOJK_029056 [Asimina triloba]